MEDGRDLAFKVMEGKKLSWNDKFSLTRLINRIRNTKGRPKQDSKWF